MLRFIVLSTIVSFSSASGYGGGINDGYGGGGDGGYGRGGGYAVPAAVISHHNIKHYDVPSSGHVYSTTIDVPPNVLPINFVFRSASSLVNVQHKHEGAAGSYKETHSQDEPHVLKHTVTKPIIQEVREIISPFRRIQQTVEPVREEIQTLVARAHFNTQEAALGTGIGVGGNLGGEMNSNIGGEGGDYRAMNGGFLGGDGGALGLTKDKSY